MQKVIVQIDWYTKVVLTLIAVLLAGLLAKPYIIINPAKAETESKQMDRILGKTAPSYGKLEVIDLRSAYIASRYEGSCDLVGYLYFYTLQSLSQEEALKIIDESPILSDYPLGRKYAKFLIKPNFPRHKEWISYISNEVIETVLRSGRFKMTPYGIAPYLLGIVNN